MVAVLSNDQVMITFEPNEEQQSRMRDKAGDMKVRGELSRPLTQEFLKILEDAAGMKLYDIGFLGLGGRVLRTEYNLSGEQMQNVVARLSAVSGVKYVEENSILRVYPIVENDDNSYADAV